jgi:hypothetical protein
MGADFVSYSVVVPSGKTNRLVASEIRRINKALSHRKIGEFHDEALGNHLGINICEYLDSLGEHTDRDEVLGEIGHDLSLVRHFGEAYISRDSGAHRATIRGTKVIFMFAGEMSWGDEPGGDGYNMLRALWRLGIASKLQASLK